MAKITTKTKLKHAAGWVVGAGIMVAAACVVGPGSTPSTTSAVAHVSQQRVDDEPIAFVEVSAARFVGDENPRGCAWPHGVKLETDGWGVLLPDLLSKRAAGYRVAALWEPGLQSTDYGDPADCMAWISRERVQKNWSEAMRLSWPRFVAELRAAGMEPMWYIGCAGAHVDTMVEDLAFCSEMGLRIVGLDAFSWLVETDLPTAKRLINEVRADPRTKDLTLITEGWLPKRLKNGEPLGGADRALFLRHMAQMSLARGSENTLAAMDPNWEAMSGLPMDQKIVPVCVGIVVMHGANWKPVDLEACYARAKQLGLVPCDYRVPLGKWKD